MRKKGYLMTIDTQIRHVTKSGANLFRELGFTPDEAERFQAESKQQINAMTTPPPASDALPPCWPGAR
jgi:hypothetical protein